MRAIRLYVLALAIAIPSIALSAGVSPTTRPASGPGDADLAAYFRAQTDRIASRCLADVHSLEDWNARKAEYRRQLAEMLGLWPEPARTDLKPVISGKIDHDDFRVEKLYFQSMPGLYVTGDLYLPKDTSKPCPTILYVCGHAEVKKNGVSYGNKTFYQHHGEWFARNGYVCLVIDTLQLGEIEGIHHGTYRYGMWWWHSRGYTPAGVEAWNGIRALDYLDTRSEVDRERIGMTGRSGGGAYTWWVSALDDRVKVAAPVAGITDLHNHVVDGTIEGHCDCMFMVNTYRWDFPQVAALVAPRPLLICNSDKDSIFPLDGVYRVHEQVRRIYKLYNAEQSLGLIITEGPHKDTQEIRIPAFAWFNRFLKKDENLIDKQATPFFTPQELRAFSQLPSDQINTTIQETFVPKAPAPKVPESKQEWQAMRDGWMAALRSKTFAGWPESVPPIQLTPAFSESHDGVRLAACDFDSQQHVRLRLYVATEEGQAPRKLVLNVLDEQRWPKWIATMRTAFAGRFSKFGSPAADSASFDRLAGSLRSEHAAIAWLAPRGIGPTAWNPDPKEQVQIKRRFALLGQTLDGMRVWDVCRAIQALRDVEGMSRVPLQLHSERVMAGVALYASLFEPGIADLDLTDLPTSHRNGPDLLNVLKTMDIPAAVAMAAERCEVRLQQKDEAGWDYPREVAKVLGWGEERMRVTGPSHDSRR